LELIFAGVRRGREHTPKDQELADTGVFVIENLCNLAAILDGKESETFIANTYPVNYTDMTGLPCRVVDEKILNRLSRPRKLSGPFSLFVMLIKNNHGLRNIQ